MMMKSHHVGTFQLTCFQVAVFSLRIYPLPFIYLPTYLVRLIVHLTTLQLFFPTYKTGKRKTRL